MFASLFAEARGLKLPKECVVEMDSDGYAEAKSLLSSGGSILLESEPVDSIGETYEWLLKQYPSFSSDGALELHRKTSKARKHSGSYYTPQPLVSALLDRSLDPLLRKTEDPLSLRILDPSVGTGRFLLSTARRIADSSGIEIGKVISSCLFGADTNPTAVEVCIASLCLEAGDMSLAAVLEKRIVVGNLLLGTSGDEVQKGIPDEAYQALDGDNPTVCRQVRLRNANLREDLSIDLSNLTRSSFDAWCAAFLQRKSKRSMLSDALTQSKDRQSVQKLTRVYQILHPELTYPDVLTSESDVQGNCRRDAGGPSYQNYNGFDLVIGNPPYVPLYSRKSASEDKLLARSANLATFINKDIEGQPALSGRTNTFLLFLSLGARLAKKGGTVAYVLPDSFATNESYIKTRRVLVEKGWLRSFTTYTNAFFGETAVRTSLLVWSRSEAKATLIEEAANPNEPAKSGYIDRDKILSRQGANLKLKAAFEIPEGWVRLGDIAEIKDGINPGSQKTRKRIVASLNKYRLEPWKPAIVGNDIEPMKLQDPSIQVCYDQKAISQKEKKAGTSLRDPRIFESERIVYRQTASRPIACICPAGVYSLNSVHNVLLKDPNQEVSRAICTYLNTGFCARIYADMTGETRNLFPQVHASSMRQLPIPQELLDRNSAMRQAAEISVEKLNDLLDGLFKNLNG